MVSLLYSKLRGPGSSAGQGHCTLNTRGLFFSRRVGPRRLERCHERQSREKKVTVENTGTGNHARKASGTQGHCVVFLGKTLNCHSVSLHPGVRMDTGEPVRKT